ncbi:molybdopterin-dependent oxidoreductase [Tateyamaria sp. SN6-1]|uniref:molybdopterin-dependent oxidoreductase n=1 Tax=Tateyamaria sp. SN6-1 TaxID=3092148 RepID=UPI0039F4848E
MSRTILSCILSLIVATGVSLPARADTTMSLKISGTGANAPVVLTLEDLDAMPQVSFSTSTIWTDGDVTFSGVPLKALLQDAAETGTTVEMVALNDYKVAMPLSELEDGAPIVATRMDGAVMSVRDKGPFWVVFPYDADAKYQTETIYSYSIWQLNRLEVVD